MIVELTICLGPFHLVHNHETLDHWPSRKGLGILEYLVLQHPAPVPKEVLMDLFWPGVDSDAARRNLHQAIYAVHQVFKKHGLPAQVLQFGQDEYYLDSALGLWADLVEFERHVKAGRRYEALSQAEQAMTEYGIAQGLYQGDLLASLLPPGRSSDRLLGPTIIVEE